MPATEQRKNVRLSITREHYFIRTGIIWHSCFMVFLSGSRVLCVFVATFLCVVAVTHAEVVRRHFDHDQAIQQDFATIKVGDILNLGFQSKWHMTSYVWTLSSEKSYVKYLKPSGYEKNKRGDDNFVFNFTGIETGPASTDRLIFECAPAWNPKDVANSVFLNVTVTK
jgi:hypothetical protein